MNQLPKGLKQTTLALSITALASPAFSQAEPGAVGTLTFSQGLEVSDNPTLSALSSDTVITSRTALGFGYRSETTTQVFTFDIGAEYVKDFDSSSTDDSEIENANARVEYTRENANSLFSLFAAYRESELEDEVVATGIGSDVLVIDSGTLKVSSAGIRYELGTDESPFGLNFGIEYSDRDYTDTVDPDLEDTQVLSVDALARFQISPTTAVRARVGQTREDQEDATDTQITDTYYGLGLEGETGGGISYTADVLFDETETDDGAVTSEDGVGIELSVVQDRNNGSIGATVTSRIDESGRRTAASIRRDIELALGGLGFSIGVVDQEDDDSLRYTAGLDYTRETRRGLFTASLSQTPGTSDGDAFLNTEFSLNYSADINDVSGWSAGVSYFEANELSGTDDDSRTSASIAYRRDITDEWGMNAGLTHTRVDEAGVGDRSRNTLFFNVQRDISFGF